MPIITTNPRPLRTSLIMMGGSPKRNKNNSELESSPAYIYGDIVADHLLHQEGSRRAQTRIFPGPCFLTRRQAFYIRQRNNLSPFCCDHEQHQYKAPTSAQFACPQLPCALFLAWQQGFKDGQQRSQSPLGVATTSASINSNSEFRKTLLSREI